ncbi:MAG TPA: hypothetical protein VHF25_02445 [Nitriliruptorales bacterium]|nr:hypothetical protein [Nitriliruptorales bacterium]
MRPSEHTIVALLTGAALTATACGNGEEPPLADATRTTPPATVTVTETVTATPTPTATEQRRRAVIVAPQEPVTVEPGEERQFSVPATFRDQRIETFGLGWLPCTVIDATAPGELTFPDTDDDGTADRIGESNEGQARLRLVNGEPYENVDQQWPTIVFSEGDTLTFTMLSEAPDCTVPMVFIDADGDEELDLKDDDTPSEFYGVGQVEWRR